MAARHTREEILAFSEGEAAQVLARDRVTGDLVFLDRGQAAAHRPVAKQQYECPMPGCAAPSPLTTRGGSRRDHFAHLAPSSHPGGVESLFHLMAKHRIAEWARAHADEAGAIVDVAEEATIRDEFTHRRADVMVSWSQTGQRVAFEVEYKSVQPDEWWAKHRDYLNHEIVPVWLFGHTRRYLREEGRLGRTSADGEPLFRLTPVTEQVIRAGGQVLFINPVEAAIGTLFEIGATVEEYTRVPSWWTTYGVERDSDLRVGDVLRPAPSVQKTSARLSLAKLEDCVLDPIRGMVTPMTRLIEQVATRTRMQLDELAVGARASEEQRRKDDAERRSRGDQERPTTLSTNGARNIEFMAQRCTCGHVRNVHVTNGPCSWCQTCHRMTAVSPA